MFYRTINGAQVGDLFMNIVHICELNGVNPFEYLYTLQNQDAEELQEQSSQWMPWNYKVRLEALVNTASSQN